MAANHEDALQFNRAVINRRLSQQDIQQWLPQLTSREIDVGPLQPLCRLLVRHWTTVMDEGPGACRSREITRNRQP